MYLITGSTGLVGAHLLLNLTLKGEKIKALIRTEDSKKKIKKIFTYYRPNENFEDLDVEWVLGDLLDVYSLEKAFKDVSHVYHCAALVSFDEKEKRRIFDTNIRGTANIVNACLTNSIEKLVHVSSIAAVKTTSADKLSKEENGWPSDRNSVYAYSKTQSEFEVWRGIAEGLNAVIVNPGVILGFGNWNDGSSALFKRIYNGMRYFTKGATGFVDVRDVIKAMIQLMDSEFHSRRYILNSENVSFEAFFKKVATAFNIKPPAKLASPLLTGLAWRIEKVRSTLLFTQAQITRATANSAHKVRCYSSARISGELSFNFIPIDESIEHTCKEFLKLI